MFNSTTLKLTLLLLFVAQFSNFAQGISLSRLDYSPKKFYICSVQDNALQPYILGKVFGETSIKKQISFNGQMSFQVFNSLQNSTKKDEMKFPIILKINELIIKEDLSKSNLIIGKCVMFVTFELQRNDSVSIPLTTFETSLDYTRSFSKEVDYGQFIKNRLGKITVFLDDWITKNYDKTPTLAHEVKVIFMEDYMGDTSAKSDTVFWSPNCLKWTDFMGTPSTKSKNAAEIHTNFEYFAPVKIKNGVVSIYLNMKTFALKNMSWVTPIARDSAGLAHEQLHFDITKIITERYKKRVKSMALSVDNYDSQFQILFIDIYREMNQLQRQYDEETAHSINVSEQKRWSEKITKMLAELRVENGR
jgi:hypothetical protein